ncbi:hypothetical protein D9M72_580050 [compost metagenome]
MGADAAVLLVAPAPRAQQQHRRRRNPAAQRMHHHRAGKVMERCAGHARDPVLHTKALVPGDAFEERIDKTHQHEGGDQLRIEA